MTTTLVLGAGRSGKSAYAESLLSDHSKVTFVATGQQPWADKDPERARRVLQHRARRPQGWQTVESRDLTRALLSSRHPVLVDGIAEWVGGIIDSHDIKDPEKLQHDLIAQMDELVVAWRHVPFDVVAVTEEVGWGQSGTTEEDRIFRETLGYVNARLSRASHRVHLVVAGRVLDLSKAPLVPSGSL